MSLELRDITVRDRMDPLKEALDSSWRAQLDHMLGGGEGIRAVFQPVVDLQRGVVCGFEALTRFETDDGAGPEVWFERASRAGLGPQLDALAINTALRARADLPRNCFLAVNVEPESLLHEEVCSALHSSGSLSGLVLELTEHRQASDPQRFDAILATIRSQGAHIAVDDAGSGYSGLQQILHLRPSFLKLDRSLVEDIDAEPAKASLVEMLGTFANRIDAWLLAEGVETAAEAETLAELGVPLVQGYFFAKPAPPWVGIESAAIEAIRNHATKPADTLHRITAPAPVVETIEDARRELASTSSAWAILVDDHGAPVGLIDRDCAVAGVNTPAIRAAVDHSPVELAHRISTSHATDPHVPVIVTDHAGRPLGLVHLRQLLTALCL